MSSPSPARLLQADDGVQVLAERLSAASQVPPCVGREKEGAAIIRKGRVIYAAVPLFSEAIQTGTPFPGEVVRELCRALLDQPLLRHSAGSTVAAHLHRSTPGYTLHLVHWALDRWGKQVNSAATFPKLGPINVELALPESVRAVTLEPAGTPIPYSSTSRYLPLHRAGYEDLAGGGDHPCQQHKRFTTPTLLISLHNLFT